MHATNEVEVVKRFAVISLIAVAILEDGRQALGNYMAEAGFPGERKQLLSVLSVAIQDEDPKLIVKFNFRGDEPGSVEEGTFFIWINDDETIGGDF